MFCPVCKAEYRLGITHCPDCDVDLVEQLTADGSDGRDVATDSEGNLLVWSGVEPHLYRAICDALDSAGIAHHDTDREFGLPAFGQKMLLVWVSPGDWARAGMILEEVLREPDLADRDDIRVRAEAARLEPFRFGKPIYSTEPERRADPFAAVSTESLLSDNASTEATPDDIVEDFHPDEATSEVWSGEEEMEETVRLCLRENGIGCVVEGGSDGKQHLRVMPSAEARAKEIVREVVEATPPE
ncbi:MAG TPA: hypothetical protein VMH00_12305 [Candidatus Limnocylindrales bacterium]|nr:hypothetical protein [Candidatus Limnocylindrales bacterium]